MGVGTLPEGNKTVQYVKGAPRPKGKTHHQQPKNHQKPTLSTEKKPVKNKKNISTQLPTTHSIILNDLPTYQIIKSAQKIR